MQGCHAFGVRSGCAKGNYGLGLTQLTQSGDNRRLPPFRAGGLGTRNMPSRLRSSSTSGEWMPRRRQPTPTPAAAPEEQLRAGITPERRGNLPAVSQAEDRVALPVHVRSLFQSSPGLRAKRADYNREYTNPTWPPKLAISSRSNLGIWASGRTTTATAFRGERLKTSLLSGMAKLRNTLWSRSSTRMPA
jgi:hypothetical protein